MEMLIVTGLSGTGKTSVMHALEDIGYYCVDNLPSNLFKTLFKLCDTSNDPAMKKVALGIDVRGGDRMLGLYRDMKEINSAGANIKILFLDAQINILVSRFKETRRRHPLIDFTPDNSLEGALSLESTFLESFKKKADYVIDTTYLTTKQLKQRVLDIFLVNEQESIVISFMSFGFKYGVPMDCDSIFDVRCLPNPFYSEKLKTKTGFDKDVCEYVFSTNNSKIFVDNLIRYLDFAMPLYIKEGKAEFVVGIGCTGGQHRSVCIANLLQKHFDDKGYKTTVSHRDISKNR